MRICITAKGSELSSPVDERFGRAPYFHIWDTETGKHFPLKNPGPASEHGAGVAASKAVISHGVEVLITGQLGPNAVSVLGPAKIAAYRIAGQTVAEAKAAFSAGELARLLPEPSQV